MIHEGDCLVILPAFPENSVDAVVTDPPYGLEFMGKEWDSLGTGRKGNPFDPHGQAFERGGSIPLPPTPRFDRKRMPKCRRCGKWRYNASKASECACGDPEFVTDTWTYPRRMQSWHLRWATEALRVLKPGGYMLAMGGTRTAHRMVCALEDAGFEIRDTLCWLYGSGFPKSLDVSKAIDRAARRDYVLAAVRLGLTIPGNSLHDWTKAEHAPSDSWWEQFKSVLFEEDWRRIEREVVSQSVSGKTAGMQMLGPSGIKGGTFDVTEPATAAAKQWDGWGTALKPAHEMIVLARKPLSEPTVAENVLRWNTGAINIDACRIATDRDNVLYCNHEQGASGAVRIEDSDREGDARSGMSVLRDDVSRTKEQDRQNEDADVFIGLSISGDERGQESSMGGGAVPHGRRVRRGSHAQGLHAGAPMAPGEVARQGADRQGDRASQERQPVGQPTAEPTPEGQRRTPHHGSPRDPRPQDGSANESQEVKPPGRWPANVLLGCACEGAHAPDCAVRMLDEQSGESRTRATGYNFERSGQDNSSHIVTNIKSGVHFGDRGGASRFFYTAKSSRADRDSRSGYHVPAKFFNSHPTVKPVDLMRWLIRLVTPPGGTVLDPFLGSGSTAVAAMLEGFEWIGIERDPEYVRVAKMRVEETFPLFYREVLT